MDQERGEEERWFGSFHPGQPTVQDQPDRQWAAQSGELDGNARTVSELEPSMTVVWVGCLDVLSPEADESLLSVRSPSGCCGVDETGLIALPLARNGRRETGGRGRAGLAGRAPFPAIRIDPPALHIHLSPAPPAYLHPPPPAGCKPARVPSSSGKCRCRAQNARLHPFCPPPQAQARRAGADTKKKNSV